MSEEKNVNVEKIMETVKSDSNSAWSGDWWIWTFILMICFGGWNSHDTTNHELRERVAKLEGQVDIISRR